ncbi:MAG: glutathione ABC transporter permease GsiC [Chloroflexota bacterium]
MGRYFAYRLLSLVPTVVGITVIVFVAVKFLPGDVVQQMLGEYGAASRELREYFLREYALDLSLPQQYARWMVKALQGDLGVSILSGRPVVEELKQRLPVTFQLGVMALVIAWALALPVGILSALYQDSLLDYILRGLAIGLLALPTFWMALLIISYGFIFFGWTPPLRYYPFQEDPIRNLQILGIPAFVLGTHLSAIVMRLLRSTMLEVLRQDYVRMARAKGLPEFLFVARHALPNALIPVMTLVALQVPLVVGGTVIMERIFALPGMGNYLLSAVQQREYPIVQAITLLSAFTVVLSNFAVDILYGAIDPRIRYSEQ